MKTTMKKARFNASNLLLWALFLCSIGAANADNKHAPAITQSLLQANSHPYFANTYSSKERETLQSLYQLNAYQLLWFSVEHPVKTINQLLNLYADAPSQGLIAADYAHLKLEQQWRTLQQSKPSLPQFLAFDTALSLTFLRYLNDLHDGRIPAQQQSFYLKPKIAVDFASRIYTAIKTESVSALAQDMEPKLPPYQQLKIALKKYRYLNAQLKEPVHFNFERALQPGDWSTQVGKLQNYLNALNSTSLTPQIDTDTNQYSQLDNTYIGSIVTKVRNLQADYNLDNDGVIGKQTLKLLNTPLRNRIEQIELSMERLRWLPEQQPGPFILVNIPAFQLWAYHTDKAQNDNLSMKVIVGKSYAANKDEDKTLKLQTPIFSGNMSYLVFRPYWNIPYSILTEEILPLFEHDPTYLERNDLEIVANFSHQAIPLPSTAENIKRLYTKKLHLRQRPGAKNALGHIKFMFPNNYNIYLHDTPGTSLFRRSKRDFSHGCIRVEKPSALALFALRNNPGWTEQKIAEAIYSDAPSIVNLEQKIPVLIFYSTALATQSKVSFYPDIYNHDKALKTAISERSQRLATRSEDITTNF
ncbi:MAG: L,D-transpeptidase family protein [Methyloprofundus sp.]|nr:L,D-transpeptidase family protein [Methyloprofundus sp.]